VGDARIATIKQQIMTSLDNMYLTADWGWHKATHKVEEKELDLMQNAITRCSCHQPSDPNGYEQELKAWYPQVYAQDYLNIATMKALAKILVQQIKTLKKIAS
jgi:hypothetical protein